MSKRLLLFFLFFPCLLFAQEQNKTLLIVPLSKNKIQLNSLTEKNIKYNNISRDSIVNYILSSINSEIQILFKNYSVHYFKEFTSRGEFPDSIYNLKLFNCFYFDLNDSSLKNIKNKSFSLESYHNNYYGCDLNSEAMKILKNAITSSKCDYVLFINKYEIINPNSFFSLQVELMDNSLNRIYGNKNEIKREISKTMYPDVLKYYIKNSSQDMLEKVRTHLENK